MWVQINTLRSHFSVCRRGSLKPMVTGLSVLVALALAPGVTSAGSTAWQAPERLGSGLDQSLHVSAANESGQAVAIWEDYEKQGVFASYRSAAGVWGGPELAAPDTVDYRHMAVTIDADGVVTLVYKGGCTACGMRARQRAVDGTWSSATELEDFDPRGALAGNTYEDVQSPAVAAGPDGRVTAVWSVGGQGVRQQVIRTSTLEAGTWSTAQLLSDGLHADDNSRIVYEHRAGARIALDGAGRTVVLWNHSFEDTGARGDWTKNMVHLETSARAPAAAAFVRGAEVARRTADETPMEAQLAMAEDGVATFTWTSVPSTAGASAGGRSSLRARRRSAAGALGDVATVNGSDFSADTADSSPLIAVTPGGDATIVWTRSDAAVGAADKVLVRTWNAAGSWERQDEVAAGVATEAVDVAAGRDKTVAVSWQRVRGDRSERRAAARLRRPDGTWAAPVTLGGPDAQTSLDPFVAVEGNGDALAIWRSQSFNDSTFTQTDFVETMSTRASPPDTESPRIVIGTPPTTKATYAQGERVAASYACTDDRAVASCEGPVAAGAAVDTTQPGTNIPFKVVAVDRAGHTTTATHFYDVRPGPKADTGPRDTVNPEISIPTPAPPAARPTPAQQTAALDKSTRAAVKSAPKNVPAKLLAKGISLKTTTTLPNTGVAGGISGLLVPNGGRLISDNGLGVIAPGGGNIVSTYGGGVVAPGGGNKIVAARAKKGRPLMIAYGRQFRATPGAVELKITLTREGRGLVKSYVAAAKRLRRGGRRPKPLVLTFATAMQTPDTEPVVATRKVTIRG